jgi:hypothetical protein
MNIAYRDLYLLRVRSAIAAAQAARGVAHHGLRGLFREIFVRQLLRPLIPIHIGLGTGEIVTAHGQHSSQQDVVMYDTRVLPPFLADPSVGLFPLESVLYAIEVKSTLTADGLRQAHDSAQQIDEFDYEPGFHSFFNEPVESPIWQVIPTLFAFDSDLNPQGRNEIDRYRDIEKGEPPLKAICVVGRGYWYWDAYREEWGVWPRTYEFEEVVGYLSGVMNTYGRIALTRGFPPLQQYFTGVGYEV